MPTLLKIRKLKENIEIGDKKSNDKGVSPHLFPTAKGCLPACYTQSGVTLFVDLVTVNHVLIVV